MINEKHPLEYRNLDEIPQDEEIVLFERKTPYKPTESPVGYPKLPDHLLLYKIREEIKLLIRRRNGER